MDSFIPTFSRANDYGGDFHFFFKRSTTTCKQDERTGRQMLERGQQMMALFGLFGSSGSTNGNTPSQ